MATITGGRISDADRERVRDASRIDIVVGEYVALKPAGVDNFKGLCPFHDEKTPSFTVSAARGFYHCFGCGEGGDVFDFLMKIDQLTFVEAVQHLAERAGITLTLQTSRGTMTQDRGSRSRLLAVTRATAAFYAEQLAGDEAAVARTFLTDRGFDAAAAAHFGCGFAPGGWDRLIKHLLQQGFSLEEMIDAGVARRGQQGPIDQFHRRLVWAIRDAAGDVVGFGARRIFDDDRLEAKYVNTSGANRLYRKSQVLYGLDLAKRQIAKQRQVVVVEGYTDVMAMHLAGVTTAVAACGTAFGDEHISILRRYLMDSDLLRGEVIYVFDGDEAGQQAARKAFDSDQRFAAHTYVAVAPDGMDPCELRQQRGDMALRELIRTRIPLFRFAIGRTLDDYDLETVEGRTAALTATAPMVAGIKDPTARAGYVQELAGRIGIDPAAVDSRVRRAAREVASRPAARRSHDVARRHTRPARGDGPAAGEGTGRASTDRIPTGAGDSGAAGSDAADTAGAAGSGFGEVAGSVGPSEFRRPDPSHPRSAVERETLKLALQFPALIGPAYDQVYADAITEPAYQQLHAAVVAAGGPPAAGGAAWVTTVVNHLPAGPLRSLVTELAVEPVRCAGDEPDARYAGAILARMAERHALLQERSLASALQRAETAGDRERAAALHEDLSQITTYRRALSDRARGVGTP